MKKKSEQNIYSDRVNTQAILKHIQDEIEMLVPDYREYLLLTIGFRAPHLLFYKISNLCPNDKYQKIEKVILENATLLNLPVTNDEIE